MDDLSRILQLVEDGALKPAEADRIIAALVADQRPESGGTVPPRDSGSQARAEAPDQASARHLRVQVSDGGRQVVNLRVPINVASFAAGFVPGLPDAEAERVREAIRSGTRGTIVDITSEDGDRVLITTE